MYATIPIPCQARACQRQRQARLLGPTAETRTGYVHTQSFGSEGLRFAGASTAVEVGVAYTPALGSTLVSEHLVRYYV